MTPPFAARNAPNSPSPYKGEDAVHAAGEGTAVEAHSVPSFPTLTVIPA